MTMTTGPSAGGLIFETPREIDIVEIANLAASGIEALGQRVRAIHILSDIRARVLCAAFAVRITVEEDCALPGRTAPAALHLGIEISRRSGERSGRHSRDSLLARTLAILHDHLAPDLVHWSDAGALIPGAEFARAAGLPAPRPDARPARARAGCGRRLPDVEATSAQLLRRIEAHDPLILRNVSAPDRARRFLGADRPAPAAPAEGPAETPPAPAATEIETAPPRRLSAWLFTIAVAMLALPVGIALLILNFTRGENLRLAAQSAALSGTFVGLETCNVTAQALATLQGVLG